MVEVHLATTLADLERANDEVYRFFQNTLTLRLCHRGRVRVWEKGVARARWSAALDGAVGLPRAFCSKGACLLLVTRL